MLDPNPFAGWLSSNPFGGSWVTVAQSRSPLIGPPFVNGCLAQLVNGQDSTPLLDSTESPVHGLGAMYGERSQPDGSARSTSPAVSLGPG